MNVLTDRETILQHVKNFIGVLKQSARSSGGRLRRNGTAYLVDRSIVVTTPLEEPATPYRVVLVEISNSGAAFVTSHYLSAGTLVVMQLSGQHGVPARVSKCKRKGDECQVDLEFVLEYDHEVYLLADDAGQGRKRHAKGLLAWLMG